VNKAYKQRPAPTWEPEMHWAFKTEYVGMYRDPVLKITMHTCTPRKADGSLGKQEVVYKLDGDIREFLTEETLIDALMDSPAELWVHVGTTRQPTGGHGE
jgi:hypothetical protein